MQRDDRLERLQFEKNNYTNLLQQLDEHLVVGKSKNCFGVL